MKRKLTLLLSAAVASSCFSGKAEWEFLPYGAAVENGRAFCYDNKNGCGGVRRGWETQERGRIAITGSSARGIHS